MTYKLEEFKIRILSSVIPWLFLVSMLVSFSACALIGKWCSGRNLFDSFIRFYPEISAERQFYPTYSELYQLAVSRVEKGKTLVVVSGDSIFFGLGQDREHVWSRHLAKNLGDKFNVVNLAFRGGRVFEGGYWVYEKLRQDGFDVVLVTNTWADRYIDVEPQSPYTYLYWDARGKNLLANYSERDQVIRLASKGRGKQTCLTRGKETSILYTLDGYLFFRDLWNTVSYKGFNTTWTDGKGTNYFYPRKFFVDEIADEFKPGQVKKSDAFWKDLIESEYIVKGKDNWKILADKLNKTVVPEVRDRILVVFVEPNQKFVQNPEPLNQTKQSATDIFNRHGFDSVTISDISTSGYVDGVHLNNDGGRELAEQLTAAVRNMVAEE